MIILRIVKKFRQILSRHQKIRVVELGVLMVISGFMEMLSVTLILPFMDAVMEPERIMLKSYIRWVVNLLGIEKPRSFLILLALVLAAMYIIKNIFLLFQMLFQNRFVYHQLFLTQKQLLRSYLSRPYEYYLSVKSGEVLRVIGTDTTDAFAILTQILMMFSELVVSAVLMVTIFVMAPLLTVSAGAVLLVMILLIQRFSRPLLRKAGVVARKRRADMNQWMLQSIQGIKEVKLMRKESYFERNFDRAGNEYVRALYQNITLGSVPRFMIEASTMSVLFIAIALMIGNGAALKELLPVLSGIAMAAVRLLPAASRISACLASITYGEPAVDKLLENLKTVREYDSVHGKEQTENTSTDRRISSLAKEIRMENVTYRYPSGSVDILENAGFTIRSGQSVGIVGASGAGKTTAVDVLLGLLRPQGGSVLVDGTDIRLDMTGWLSNIGYIPQAIFMLDGNIRENVAFGLA
nr:ABC transporter ATP-binding protein/permease [Lachnospiraceae bacterium]